MILFNNGSGEFGANSAFAFFGNGNNVDCFHCFKERAGRLWRPLCESGGLLVHPTLEIISAFKEGNGLVAAVLGAEELASEQLVGASVTEVCCP